MKKIADMKTDSELKGIRNASTGLTIQRLCWVLLLIAVAFGVDCGVRAWSESTGDGLPNPAYAMKVERRVKPSALADAAADFKFGPGEFPIFGETFSQDSIFSMETMVIHDGIAVSEPSKNWSQASYTFDRPLDVREGDITIYWAFFSDPSVGEERGKLYTYLNFTDPPKTNHPEPARVALNVRPGAWCMFYRDPGWQLKNDPEWKVDVPGRTFPDRQTVERFRLVIRWSGTDYVRFEPDWWDRASASWKLLTRRESSRSESAVMELSIREHLLGHTSFRSLQFQSVSDTPRLDTVVVTRTKR